MSRNLHLSLKKSMLFVDDDPAALVQLTRLASLFGVDIQTATSAQMAMALLRLDPSKYFLVLTDEMMPGQSGTDLLMEIKQAYPSILRALMTASDDREIMEKAYRRGEIFRFISKPILEQQINDLIGDSCANYLNQSASHVGVIEDRMALFYEAIEEETEEPMSSVYRGFAQIYLEKCRVYWGQTSLYTLNLNHTDSEAYRDHLKQHLRGVISRSVKHAKALKTCTSQEFKLSDVLKSFQIKNVRAANRYVKFNEAAFSTFVALIRNYHDIINVDLRDSIKVYDDHLVWCFGSRFTYTDLFNPMLSSVARGAEIVSILLEIGLLSRLMKIEMLFEYRDEMVVRVEI